MPRSVLLSLLGDSASAERALRSVGREADRTADEVERLGRVSVGADGRLRDANGRFIATGQSARQMGDDVERSGRGFSMLGGLLGKLTPSLGGLLGALGGVAGQAGMMAAALGTAIPAAAGLASALVAIAPAAAVAATGIAAIGLAGAAFKIGMSGVSDAVSAALNPADPEAYAAALKKLSPAAAAFVGEIHKLSPAFKEIKSAVQESLFQGLDKSFASAAKTTLPIFREGLVGAAQALNGMGKGLLTTITNLGKSGALKTLFTGAADGLKQLTTVPGMLLKAFVHLGAAAAPVFVRMTRGIGDAVAKVTFKLEDAFKSGALTGAIETAVGLLKQLGQVAKNVFTIIGNVFGAANATGGGFIGTLQTITGMLAQVTANPAFQAGLQALFGVMANLATTAAPLLGQALGFVAQAVAALAPAANVLIDALGNALQPVIAALGPVLVALAQAVGALVIAFAPLLPVIGQLIAALLPVLVPVLQLVTTVLTALTPVIAVVAQALTTYLVPVITTVAGWVTQAITWFTNLAAQVFPALVAAVTGAGGPLTNLGTALGNLWNAVKPLAEAIWDLVTRVFAAVAPALVPVGAAISAAASALTEGLAWAIDNIVVPAINAFTELLTGDATAAIQGWATAVGDATASIVEDIGSLSGQTEPGVTAWMAAITIKVGEGALKITAAIKAMTSDAIDEIKSWPGKVATAMNPLAPAMKKSADAMGDAFIGGLNLIFPEVRAAFNKLKQIGPSVLSGARSLLVAAGKAIISGFVDGILSQVGAVASALGGITKMIPNWKGPEDKDRVLLRPAGVLIMGGLIDGIDSQIPALRKQLGKVTGVFGELKGVTDNVFDSIEIPIIDIGKKLKKALTGTASEIGDAVKQIAEKIKAAFKSGLITGGERDGLLDMLAGSNKQLKKLSEERQKIIDKIKEANDYAKKITSEALSFASLTSIKTEGGGTPTGQQLVAGLQAKLATIRTFSANIKKLAQAGLSKSLLRQILDAGIDGGAAIAAELANGPNSIIAALNSAQVTIEKVAKDLGLNSADLLFDSGKNAGTGFLKGLKSMEKALTEAMNQIVMALLEALGIGIDKYKKKMEELAKVMYETSLMQPKIPDGPMTPNPLKAPAAPKPYLTANGPAAKQPSFGGLSSATFGKASSIKTVNVNMGGVRVDGIKDLDAAMNKVDFKVRSLTF